MALSDFDQAVRLDVYDLLVAGEPAPTTADSARRLGATDHEVAAARRRLADLHALALRPGTTEVWMAHPFSAVATGYRVVGDERAWWANCGWDAVAIPSLVGADARVEAVCPDCGHDFDLRIENGELRGDDGVVQFCVPPSQFWADVGFT